MITREFLHALFNIEESYQLPPLLMERLLSEGKTALLDEINKTDVDLSSDLFTLYFQEEQGDRKALKQDFTPATLCEVVAGIAGEYNVVADYCAGTGGLTIKMWESNKNATYYCEEFSGRALPFLLLNLSIRNMRAQVVHCDTLTRDINAVYELTPTDKYSDIKQIEEPTLREFDVVVMNPPYSVAWDPVQDIRFNEYGLAPKSKADFAFVLHGLSTLKEGGRLVAILPHGVLFRGNSEKTIRQSLIEKRYLEGIVGVADNLFENTGIPVCLLVLSKKDNENTLFIDASKEYTKKAKTNILEKGHIKKMVDVYYGKYPVERYSCLVPVSQFVEEDYNLNIPRYVDTYVEPEPIDIVEVTRSIIECERKIEDLNKEWVNLISTLQATQVDEDWQKAQEMLQKEQSRKWSK